MKLSRRGFLKGAAAVAVAGLLPGRKAFAASSWEHRVVRVHNPLASFFDVLDFEYLKDVPESYYGNFVNQKIVYDMFDTALCRLTGEDDPVVAMKRLVPYKPGERVFIKVNNTATYRLWRGQWETIGWDEHYNDTDAIAEPINAAIRALTRIGVPQEMIGIGDASWSEGYPDSQKRTPRITPNRVSKKIKAAFPNVVLYRSSYMPGGNGITYESNDPHAIVKFRDPLIDGREQRVTSHRIPDQLIEADHFINLPIMKRHDQGGVTGAFKNNFGTIASCAYFHEPRYAGEGKAGAMYSTTANPAVDIWLNPHVGEKTRLIVCEGIFGGWNWGNDPPTGWKQFGGRSPNCILLGTDPVALDSVVFDHVTESLPDKVKDYPPPNMLVDAARLGLGPYESRKSPTAGYKTIDYLEINEKVDEAKLHKLADLKKKFKSGGKTADEIRDLLAESGAIS
ncbi:MAG: DUF362 domain-containing protein [bacterium]|nr:DUF362 domain-containing protein [bacterium]